MAAEADVRERQRREAMKRLADELDLEALEVLVRMAEMLASRSPSRRRRVK
jgi:hypothetical protein